MAVSFEYEWHDAAGQWYRSYGVELWEFSDDGLMRRRIASINDAPNRPQGRAWFWEGTMQRGGTDGIDGR